jgi:repressor LexA
VRRDELTAKQMRVLGFVQRFITQNGYPPTRREIADHFEWASQTSAEDYLRALARKGFIKIAPGKISRGLQVCKSVRVF